MTFYFRFDSFNREQGTTPDRFDPDNDAPDDAQVER